MEAAQEHCQRLPSCNWSNIGAWFCRGMLVPGIGDVWYQGQRHPMPMLPVSRMFNIVHHCSMLSPNPLRLMVEKTSLEGESKQVGSRERGIPNVPNVPNVIQMDPNGVQSGCSGYRKCENLLRVIRPWPFNSPSRLCGPSRPTCPGSALSIFAHNP